MTQKTYPVDVEGVGNFTFRHRTMRDEMRIGAEYSRLTEGVETPSPWLATLASMIAALKVQTLSAPAGWDIDAMDPLDPEEYKRIIAVHDAFRAKEDTFRKGRSADRKNASEADGGDSSPVVSTDVQASA